MLWDWKQRNTDWKLWRLFSWRWKSRENSRADFEGSPHEFTSHSTVDDDDDDDDDDDGLLDRKRLCIRESRLLILDASRKFHARGFWVSFINHNRSGLVGRVGWIRIVSR